MSTLIKSNSGEICTYTGKYVKPLDMQPEDVAIEDIAHALSNQCRYSGHTREFYSVAQHCVYMVRLLREDYLSSEMQFTGLLHDAAEAYLQDVARPLKEDPYFGKAYRGAESRAEKVIAGVFGFIYPFPPEIKVADVRMLAAERRDLMPEAGEWEVLRGVDVPDFEVIPWSPSRARRIFLEAYDTLDGRRRQ